MQCRPHLAAPTVAALAHKWLPKVACILCRYAVLCVASAVPRCCCIEKISCLQGKLSCQRPCRYAGTHVQSTAHTHHGVRRDAGWWPTGSAVKLGGCWTRVRPRHAPQPTWLLHAHSARHHCRYNNAHKQQAGQAIIPRQYT
jgi:hypothetical protein